MEILLELEALMKRSQIRHIEVITSESDSDSKWMELYEGVKSGDFSSDLKAANALYPGKGITSSFRKLKSRLIDRMVNTLFFIDSGNSPLDEFQKIYFRVRREALLVDILLGRGVRKSGIYFAKRVYRHSKQYEFTEIALKMARYLMRHYAMFAKDSKKYSLYREEVEYLQKCLNHEVIAEDLYTKLIFAFSIEMRESKQLAPIVEQCNRILIPMLSDQITSNQFIRFAYFTLSLCARIDKDHNQNITLLDKGIEFLSQKEYRPTSLLFTLHYQKLGSYILYREYEKGNECALTCLEIMGGKTLIGFKYK